MLCKKKHLAEIFGITERTLTNYQTTGMPYTAGGHGKDNEYDTIAVFNWLIAKAKGGNGADYYTEKARLTKAQADKEELKVGEMKESLLDANQVAEDWGKMVNAARAKMLALPVKVGPLLVDQDLESVQNLLLSYVEEALMELATNEEPPNNHSANPHTLETAPAADS